MSLFNPLEALELFKFGESEPFVRHRTEEIDQAVGLLASLVPTAEAPAALEAPALPSQEFINHQLHREASAVVAEAEQITKDAAGPRIDEALHDALEASDSIANQNPLLGLGGSRDVF